MNIFPEMTEAERMQEIAQLLAIAIERAHNKKAKIPQKSSYNSLDYSSEESVYA